MGVNVMFDFEVHGLAGEEEATSVVRALAGLVREEGFQAHEVGVGWSVQDGRYWISGETDHPVGVSRFHSWRPRFEAVLQERVRALAPAAAASINWRYPDDD
ncbi:hypothetical protein [Streptomyces lydicus]|uniref:hypothetical protein n=1 Tax=Streptomyces lydicus TaxID=47763 RepID=UPI0028707D8F|nr:hypothetical protein [Streptomyces lydicus]